MKLIITIDTEEDNWNRYSATDNPVENIQRIPSLQKLFDEYNVLPTYLITYPVATNPRSVAILKRILEDGKCEIGMHCHPWNTPPFNEHDIIRKQDTMLCNLPEALVQEKLYALNDTICKNFGIVPVSFRAGRWGFGPHVAQGLCRLGYRVDTSVTPFYNWVDAHGPDFSEFESDLFRFNSSGLDSKDAKGPLLEVPVTISFLQTNFIKNQMILNKMNNKLSKNLHFSGILQRLGLLNKIWLSPEMAGVNPMIKLAKNMYLNNYSCLNMTFHSTSLRGGLNNFVAENCEYEFIRKIKDFLSFCRRSGWQAITLSQFGETVFLNQK